MAFFILLGVAVSKSLMTSSSVNTAAKRSLAAIISQLRVLPVCADAYTYHTFVGQPGHFTLMAHLPWPLFHDLY